MIPMATWTPEFCMVCDKQCILGSVYCSEECRENDYYTASGLDDETSGVGSPHAPSSAYSNDVDASESSEEEEELPKLWLDKTQEEQHSGQYTSNLSNLDPNTMDVRAMDSQTMSDGRHLAPVFTLPRRPFPPAQAMISRKKKELQFRYASPVLRPTKMQNDTGHVSPLMMPQAAPTSTDNVSAQSMNTYKRWLADGNIQ